MKTGTKTFHLAKTPRRKENQIQDAYPLRLCGLARQPVLVVLLCFLSITVVPAMASPLSPQDFTAGMRLTLGADAALNKLPLPAEAYRGTVSPCLNDIAVFNGSGEPVPYALLPQVIPKKEVEILAVPLFPLPSQDKKGAGGMALRVQTDATGAIVNLTTGSETEQAAPPTVYIIDASRLKNPVAGLDLAWSPLAGNYLGTLHVEVSDDLQRWIPHAVAAIAGLRGTDSTLERQIVEFPAVRAKYLRLTLEPQADLPKLTGASARLASATAEPPRSRLVLATTAVKGGRGDYLANTQGHLPVDRIGLVFPEENSVVRVTVSSRQTADAPWTVRRQGTLYRLHQGGRVLESPPLELPPVSDRYWLIHVDEGSLGSGTPGLKIGWLPHRLVFVARGPAPFLLAWGSAREDLTTLRDDCLLSNLQGNDPERVRPAPAVAGPPEELGGKRALRPHIAKATWKRGLLWGALGLGVALLAAMALRLWRELKERDRPS